MKGEEITNWSGKEQTVQEDFIWGVGPEALYQNRLKITNIEIHDSNHR